MVRRRADQRPRVYATLGSVAGGNQIGRVAALARGLPLVAVPVFADQMPNADRLVEAHIGR